MIGLFVYTAWMQRSLFGGRALLWRAVVRPRPLAGLSPAAYTGV